MKREKKKEMPDNKVYTRTGDDGTTSLFSGKRVPKHNLRIQAYGTIDELNSWMGIIRDTAQSYNEEIIGIQRDLLTIGAQLANDKAELPIPKIDADSVVYLEKEIDQMTLALPPLKNFVLPGGHTAISYTHLARSVCRRAERYITELNEHIPIDDEIIFYINRLSDYLFTLSRKLTQDLDVQEIKWNPQGK